MVGRPDRQRNLRKRLISEVTTLPENLFAGLNQAIASSAFWRHDNDATNTEMNNVGKRVYVSQTDAAEVLGDAIQSFFKSQSFPITIAVNSVDPSGQKPDAKVKFPIGKGHKLYPDGMVVGAEQDIQDGRFVMYIHLAPVDETFDEKDVNPSIIVAKIARMIRHEIVHTQQFEKRRLNNKTSRLKAKKSYEEEGEIPPDGAPRDQYLSAGIEIDAYAHEFAEELLGSLGKQKALDILRTKFTAKDMETIGISDTLIEYLDEFGDKNFTKKLRSKIYIQMTDMIDRGLYEGKNTRQILHINGKNVAVEIADCNETRRKGLMNRLTLEEDAGMLFIFPDEKTRSFWMKETYLPLSIAYLDKKGAVIDIKKMTPLNLSGVKSTSPAKYALEMNEGWFNKNGIHVGDIIKMNIFKKKRVKLTEAKLRKVIRRLLRETFVSHSNEPLVGDHVVNSNPKCKHYGSEGIVLSIGSLDNDIGKTASYKCTNDGDSWNPGDVLEKTMDQLEKK